MAVAPDYEFYTNTYLGVVPEAAFDAQLPAAVRLVSWLTSFARIIHGEPTGENIEPYKRAMCAVIDVYAENGTDDFNSLSIGGFSVSKSAPSKELAIQAARMELSCTCPNLLYQGV